MQNAVADPNKQFNVTLSPELKKRLQEIADECEIEHATTVGAAIIKTYAEQWAQLQGRIREGKKRVEQEEMEHLARPALVKGDLEIRSKPARRKKRP